MVRSAVEGGGIGGTLHRQPALDREHVARDGGRLGGCSKEDLEEFAREDGVDPLELAARLLRGAAGYIAVLLEVMDDEAVRRA